MSEQTAKLTEAVSAVMKEIHRLKKDETNKHGGYKYVSVDDVKDHVRPLLGKHGLDVALSETEFAVEMLQTKSGQTLAAKITYEACLRHVSGEEARPERITVMLPYTGAQTTGAARSFAIKEWLKGRFLVSTGEKDMIEGGADADAYGQQEYSGKSNPITPHDEPPKSNGPQLLKRDEARALYSKLKAELYKLPTLREVSQWERANELDIMKLGDWKSYMDKEIEKHLQFIEENAPQSEAAQ